MQLWITHVLQPYLNGRRGLLLLDSFKVHLSDVVTNALLDINCRMETIPEHCTPFVQPADVCIIGPYRKEIQSRYQAEVTRRF